MPTKNAPKTTGHAPKQTRTATAARNKDTVDRSTPGPAPAAGPSINQRPAEAETREAAGDVLRMAPYSQGYPAEEKRALRAPLAARIQSVMADLNIPDLQHLAQFADLIEHEHGCETPAEKFIVDLLSEHYRGRGLTPEKVIDELEGPEGFRDNLRYFSVDVQRYLAMYRVPGVPASADEPRRNSVDSRESLTSALNKGIGAIGACYSGFSSFMQDPRPEDIEWLVEIFEAYGTGESSSFQETVINEVPLFLALAKQNKELQSELDALKKLRFVQAATVGAKRGD